ncbi:hypothetical protein JGU66_34365 [Myxococcaceae bacterium JPH2]|nr:hypothetical protein [Myxococcaceae bacterium JPH2]
MSASTTGRSSAPLGLWVGIAVVLQLGHLIAVSGTLGSPRQLLLVHDAAGWSAGLLAVFGTVAAAMAFGQGDYLRKVWAGFSSGAILSLVSTALRSYWLHAVPDVPFTESPLLPLRMVVVVLANISTTYALILLAMTYRQSGLQPPSSARTHLLWGLMAVAALAVGGPPLVTEARHLGASSTLTYSAIIVIASTLADMATILLVVPILRVAYMLRGGRLAWVWWAMGISGAVWLAYDAREWLPVVLPGEPTHAMELLRTLRTSGLALLGLAGWLQRSALGPQHEASADGALHASSGTP